MNTPTATNSGKSRQGFASISPQRRSEIASMGGKAAHAKGTAHQYTPDEARAAGRKSHQGDARKKALKDVEPSRTGTLDTL